MIRATCVHQTLTERALYEKRSEPALFMFPAVSVDVSWAIPENIHNPKNFRISKKDNCSFCRIPEPANSKS